MEIQPVQPEGATQPKYPKKRRWGELGLLLLLLAAFGLVLLMCFGRMITNTIRLMQQGIIGIPSDQLQPDQQASEAVSQKFSE